METLEDRTLMDASGPRILEVSPQDVRNAALDHIVVRFNEAVDVETFTAADMSLDGPSGPVAVTDVEQLTADTFRVTFDAQTTYGTYRVGIGPDIADLDGNPMDQNQNGTPGEAGDRYETEVDLTATTTFTAPITITEGDTRFEGQNLVINGTTVTIDGPHRFNSLRLINGAVLTHTPNSATQTHKLDLTVVREVIVDATSRVDVTARGYVAGRTTGNTPSGGTSGSYGGRAGSGAAVYGDHANPDDWGSGSNDGSGGGLVRITAGSLTLDGGINAGSGLRGAGGGIYVAVQTLAGAGSIYAGGGGSNNTSGGGGGRIAVYYGTNNGFNLNNVYAPGGDGGGGNPGGGAGTVYLRDTDEARGTLVIDTRTTGGGVTPLGLPGQTSVSIPDDVVIRGNLTQVVADHAGMTVTIGGSLTVTNGALLQFPDELRAGAVLIDQARFEAGKLVADSLTLRNGAVLTHLTSTATQMHKLEVTVAGLLTVSATSRIDVSRKGYLAGRTTGNTTLGGATGGAGGSHGGRGGNSGAAVYGDYTDPEDWGAGGGLGSGGGVVRLVASTLDLNGSIQAFGEFQGAGGSVYVSVDTLVGAGSIYANGASPSGGSWGGGGGGRIAIYYSDSSGFDLHRVFAQGGEGSAGGASGGAGTIFILQGDPHTHVRSHAPAGVDVGFVAHGNGFVDATIPSIVLKTNKPLDLSSFDPFAFEITGQMGRVVPSGITLVGDRTYRIDLPFALTENGPYHFRLLPGVKDTEGFFLDQDADGTPGEAIDDVYAFDLIVDTAPPRIVQHTPTELAGTINFVDVWFSETIDRTTFTTSDILITKPNNQTVGVTSIQEVGLNRFRLNFAAQTLVGTYHVRVGPDVRDLAGNKLDQDRDGNFGESSDDIYDAQFNLVPVDLGLSNLSVAPTALVAGEEVTVSWQGANQTGVPLLGDWTDGIYLSRDNQWDIGDVLLGTVQHTGGLAQNEIYDGSATVVLPGALPGNYRILVRADITNQERETNEANNLIASPPLTLTVHPLSNGIPTSGSLTSSDRADYYAIHLNGGESVGLILDGLAASGANELYASFGSIPTRISYDFRAVKDERFINRQDQKLAVTAPPGGGTYYVLVYGAEISGATSYNLTATTGALVVTNLTPPRQGNGQSATITLEGAGFDSNTTVKFVGADNVEHTPTAIHLLSSTTLILDLDLPNWTAQTYSVRVTKGSTTVQTQQPFEVLVGGTPSLQTRLVIPSELVVRGKQTVWLEYTNTGTAPMPAPLLRVVGNNTALITLDSELADLARRTSGQSGWPPRGISSKVEALGIGSGATPGILQPGDSGRIPIYYVGVTATIEGFRLDGSFALGEVTFAAVSGLTTTREPIYENGVLVGWRITQVVTDYNVPWSGGSVGGDPGGSLQEQMRPDSIPADAWGAIWLNLQEQIGTQYADYDSKLAQDATYLYALGQTVSDVSSLWGYEITQANAGLGPVQTLAAAVDASIATPGLGLTFSRVFGNSILARYRQGSFGRGWTTNWDVRAESDSEGDVVLRGPSGADRFFTLDRGTYRASPGDFGILTKTANGFRLTETDQTIWQFRSDNRLDFVQDTNGNKITLSYNALGQLTTLTHSSGQQLLIAYNAAGHIASVTDPLGPGGADDRVTTYEYDPAGEHLIQVTAPGNRITRYVYETNNVFANGHTLLSVEYADGTHDYFTYDTRGRLVQTARDGNAMKVTFAYDNAGGVTVTDATGRTTFLAYGLGGQLAQVRDGQGRVVNFDSSESFQLTQVIGPSGERYQYAYDLRGNVVSVTDPLRQTTTFQYDTTFNQLTGFTDARGNGIEYTYDARGNLTRITYEDGTHEDYTYDTRGNVLTSTNRRGQAIIYTYNTAGQVLTRDYSTTSGVDFVYTYDAAANLTSATDSTGTTSMQYDAATNRLTRIDYPGGQFFTFEYDSVGRRTKRTDQDGYVENYFYDDVGRLERMTDENDALIVRYEYDLAGRIAKKTLGNGVYTTYEYDSVGQILHLINRKPDDTVLSRFDYTYDASGRRTSMTTLDGTQTYGYDPLGQLTSVVYSDGRFVEYVYDGAGNRIKVIDNGIETAYATNALNQYLTVGNASYVYDLDGNLVSTTEDGITTTYTYNLDNRLVEVATPTDTWTYQYDAFGNRSSATQNGVKTNYVIDPTGLGNLAAEYDGLGNLVARYDHGYGLLARSDAAGTSAFYTFQAIGHTSELTGTGGSVLNTYMYDPFGESLGKTETVGNPFEYVGEYGVMDEGHGLEFMRARLYDTFTGRFIQQDPIGVNGGLLLYAYTKNNPIEAIDPLGLRVSQEIVNQIEDLFDVIDYAIGDQYPQYEIGKFILETTHEFATENYYYNTYVVQPFWQIIQELQNDVDNMDQGVTDAAEIVKKAIDLPPGKQGSWLPHLEPPTWRLPNEPDQSGLDGGEVNQKIIEWIISLSRDPNDKLAPVGVGDSAFVDGESDLAYQIRFENEPDALAPAQQVIITDTLDENLDLGTFQLNEIVFADQTIAITPGLDQFQTSLPRTANGVPIQVNVLATLDHESRQLTLTLTAIDPATGWMPETPSIGLLYPNDATHRGEGSISYSVAPKAGLASGTVIRNRAKIYFDYNDPIETPLVSNTLDTSPPISQVEQLPATTTTAQFTINWSGEDDPNGSGVATYDLYVALNGGPFERFLAETKESSMTILGEFGHTYAFYSIAKDNVGHTEAAPTTPDTQITVVNAPPILDSIGNRGLEEGDTLTFTATATDPNPGSVLAFSLDAGAPAGAVIDPTTGVFTWTPTEADGPGTYFVTVRVTDNGFDRLSDSETITITVKEVNQAPILAPIDDQTIDEGNLLTFTASATDADLPANERTFSLIGAPPGAVIDPNTGVFSWTPAEDQDGNYSFDVCVSDGRVSVSQTVNVAVREVNTAPVLTNPGDQMTEALTTMNLTLSATDADLVSGTPNAMTYSMISGDLAGMSLDPATGAFAWTPTDAQAGIYRITFRVTDNSNPNLTDTQTITIVVRGIMTATATTSPSNNLSAAPGTFITEPQLAQALVAGTNFQSGTSSSSLAGTTTTTPDTAGSLPVQTAATPSSAWMYLPADPGGGGGELSEEAIWQLIRDALFFWLRQSPSIVPSEGPSEKPPEKPPMPPPPEPPTSQALDAVFQNVPASVEPAWTCWGEDSATLPFESSERDDDPFEAGWLLTAAVAGLAGWTEPSSTARRDRAAGSRRPCSWSRSGRRSAGPTCA